MAVSGKIDEEICKGCLCIIRSKELGVQVNLLCHGNPFILTPNDNKTQLVCPCSDCLIKSMCRSICKEYHFYASLCIEEDCS